MATSTTQTGSARKTSASDRTGLKAGFVSRMIALIIDVVIILIAASVTYTFIKGTLTLMRIDIVDCKQYMPVIGWRALPESLCEVSRYVLAFSLTMLGPLYFVILWLFAGRTIGMGIFGLRVVKVSGKGLRIGAALMRLLGYAVCVATLGLGFLWAIVDKDRQGLHDKIARTYVIYWTGVVKHSLPPPTAALGAAAHQSMDGVSASSLNESAVVAPAQPSESEL